MILNVIKSGSEHSSIRFFGFFAVGITLISSSWACSESAPEFLEYRIDGPAQGTTYSIRYVSTEGMNLGHAVDSLFLAVDGELSAWNPQSALSRLNRGESLNLSRFGLLRAMIDSSTALFKPTGGRFDPTVAPLVRLWGFYQKNPGSFPDSSSVDSVLALCGPDKLSRSGQTVKLAPGSAYDVNGIAQGYTVDLLCDMLEKRGIENYFVEVGGELRTRGQTIDKRLWSIGIDRPVQPHPLSPGKPQERVLERVFELSGKALATSGNYRNFRYDPITKKRYGHSIDPKTGYPKQSELLSASVIASNCTRADAWATALMVAGFEDAKRLALSQGNLEVYLIYANWKGELETWETPGFASEEAAE